jgi:hypothetical protein
MKNNFSQKALLLLIVTFAFMSTAFANGKWVKVNEDYVLNLNNYTTISKSVLGCAYNGGGVLINFGGPSNFALTIGDCSLYNDKDSLEQLDDIYEQIEDFLDDDDEYMVISY